MAGKFLLFAFLAIASIGRLSAQSEIQEYGSDVASNVAESAPITNNFGGMVSVVVTGQGKVKLLQSERSLKPGAVCKIIAIPAKGYILGGWTGDVVSSDRSISFNLENGMVIEANFVPNPFLALKGLYEGRIHVVQPAPNPTDYPIRVRVFRDGSYAISFHLGKRSYHHSGKFALNGTDHFMVPEKRPSFFVLSEVSLRFDSEDSGILYADLLGFGYAVADITKRHE